MSENSGLAKTREKRSTAGRRMARLLNEEETDDFYETTYGGFNEDDVDDDYKEEKEEADQVDSDFDIDEDDAPASDTEEAEGGRRGRSRRLVTRAYKEPIKKLTTTPGKTVVKINENKAGSSGGRPTRGSIRSSPIGENRRGRKRKNEEEMPTYDPLPFDPEAERAKTAKRERRDDKSETRVVERKGVRSSTKLKSLETKKRVKVREKEADVRRKKLQKQGIVEVVMPTQEEMMEEAKLTEIENLNSLLRYEKIELERRRHRGAKNKKTGPRILYHSVRHFISESPPLVPKTDLSTLVKTKEETLSNDKSIKNDGNDSISSKNEKNDGVLASIEPKTEPIDSKSVVLSEGKKDEEIITDPLILRKRKKEKKRKRREERERRAKPKAPGRENEESRTVLRFTDEEHFSSLFPEHVGLTRPEIKRCAITGIPARFLDPVTLLPYYNSEVFKVLRAAYNRILYNRGDRRLPHVRRYTAWLERRYPAEYNKKKLIKFGRKAIKGRKSIYLPIGPPPGVKAIEGGDEAKGGEGAKKEAEGRDEELDEGEGEKEVVKNRPGRKPKVQLELPPIPPPKSEPEEESRTIPKKYNLNDFKRGFRKNFKPIGGKKRLFKVKAALKRTGEKKKTVLGVRKRKILSGKRRLENKKNYEKERKANIMTLLRRKKRPKNKKIIRLKKGLQSGIVLKNGVRRSFIVQRQKNKKLRKIIILKEGTKIQIPSRIRKRPQLRAAEKKNEKIVTKSAKKFKKSKPTPRIKLKKGATKGILKWKGQLRSFIVKIDPKTGRKIAVVPKNEPQKIKIVTKTTPSQSKKIDEKTTVKNLGTKLIQAQNSKICQVVKSKNEGKIELKKGFLVRGGIRTPILIKIDLNSGTKKILPLPPAQNVKIVKLGNDDKKEVLNLESDSSSEVTKNFYKVSLEDGVIRGKSEIEDEEEKEKKIELNSNSNSFLLRQNFIGKNGAKKSILFRAVLFKIIKIPQNEDQNTEKISPEKSEKNLADSKSVKSIISKEGIERKIEVVENSALNTKTVSILQNNEKKTFHLTNHPAFGFQTGFIVAGKKVNGVLLRTDLKNGQKFIYKLSQYKKPIKIHSKKEKDPAKNKEISKSSGSKILKLGEASSPVVKTRVNVIENMKKLEESSVIKAPARIVKKPVSFSDPKIILRQKVKAGVERALSSRLEEALKKTPERHPPLLHRTYPPKSSLPPHKLIPVKRKHSGTPLLNYLQQQQQQGTGSPSLPILVRSRTSSGLTHTALITNSGLTSSSGLATSGGLASHSGSGLVTSSGLTSPSGLATSSGLGSGSQLKGLVGKGGSFIIRGGNGGGGSGLGGLFGLGGQSPLILSLGRGGGGGVGALLRGSSGQHQVVRLLQSPSFVPQVSSYNFATIRIPTSSISPSTSTSIPTLTTTPNTTLTTPTTTNTNSPNSLNSQTSSPSVLNISPNSPPIRPALSPPVVGKLDKPLRGTIRSTTLTPAQYRHLLAAKQGQGAQIGPLGQGTQIGPLGQGVQLGQLGQGPQVGQLGQGVQVGQLGQGAQVGPLGQGVQVGQLGGVRVGGIGQPIRTIATTQGIRICTQADPRNSSLQVQSGGITTLTSSTPIFRPMTLQTVPVTSVQNTPNAQNIQNAQNLPTSTNIQGVANIQRANFRTLSPGTRLINVSSAMGLPPSALIANLRVGGRGTGPSSPTPLLLTSRGTFIRPPGGTISIGPNSRPVAVIATSNLPLMATQASVGQSVTAATGRILTAATVGQMTPMATSASVGQLVTATSGRILTTAAVGQVTPMATNASVGQLATSGRILTTVATSASVGQLASTTSGRILPTATVGQVTPMATSASVGQVVSMASSVGQSLTPPIGRILTTTTVGQLTSTPTTTTVEQLTSTPTTASVEQLKITTTDAANDLMPITASVGQVSEKSTSEEIPSIITSETTTKDSGSLIVSESPSTEEPKSTVTQEQN